MSADRFGFHFTGSAQLKDKLEHARALLSHELPSGELAALFERALDALISDREKRRFAIGSKTRRAARSSVTDSPRRTAQALRSPGERDVQPGEPAPATQRSRHIPAEVARAVYARDRGRCSFVSKQGRRCNCRVFLEVDHATPHALGGEACLANLRLRCRAHNQWHAFRFFGRKHVEAAITLRRARTAAPSAGGSLERVTVDV